MKKNRGIVLSGKFVSTRDKIKIPYYSELKEIAKDWKAIGVVVVNTDSWIYRQSANDS